MLLLLQNLSLQGNFFLLRQADQKEIVLNNCIRLMLGARPCTEKGDRARSEEMTEPR